jgi:hypothetical protein
MDALTSRITAKLANGEGPPAATGALAANAAQAMALAANSHGKSEVGRLGSAVARRSAALVRHSQSADTTRCWGRPESK